MKVEIGNIYSPSEGVIYHVVGKSSNPDYPYNIYILCHPSKNAVKNPIQWNPAGAGSNKLIDLGKLVDSPEYTL